jgi:hypothetical protein
MSKQVFVLSRLLGDARIDLHLLYSSKKHEINLLSTAYS